MTNKPMECKPIGNGFNSFTDGMGRGFTDRRCREKQSHRHWMTPHEERTICDLNFVPPPYYRPAPDWMYQDHFDWRELAVLARIYNPLDHAHDQGERDLSHRQFQPIDSYTDNMEGVKRY